VLQGFKRGLGLLAMVAVIVVVACIVLPLLVRPFVLTWVLSLLTLQFIGYAAFCVLMLLFFWIMAEAGYKVFLRPTVRARRIRKIRNKRLMLEAAARNNTLE
jgi:hypothetical protein